MKRLRIDGINDVTEFTPHLYGEGDNAHYKIEIEVRDLEGIREFYRNNPNMSVRMGGQPEGREYQRSVIHAREIEGLGHPDGYYEAELRRMRLEEAGHENQD